MKMTFLGATQEVTGSKYLIKEKGTKILVDCGLFQGEKDSSKRNWEPLAVEPSSIDAVVLTHAHIDHTGYIPLLVKNGFKGKIYCSRATYALCSILLVDSGFIHEKEAEEGTEPLYTVADAEKSLHFFTTVAYDTDLQLGSLSCKLIQSGHILGAAFVMVTNGSTQLTFSGDLGRPNQLLMPPPPHIQKTDFLVLESTYGDRLHEQGDTLQLLADVVTATIAKNGILIIPAFAVGRTQGILYALYQLQQKNSIPEVPIFLDSPMAIKVTNLLSKFANEHKLSIDECKKVIGIATYTPTVEESKGIDRIGRSAIVIAGSGMATGGRVVHHFKHFISDKKNTVLFVGYQAEGTLGRELVDGAQEVTIHDKVFNVRADIKTIDTLSAHADYNEILDWLSYLEKAPKKIFLTHGQLESAQSLQQKIKERFGWSVVIPKYLDSFELD